MGVLCTSTSRATRAQYLKPPGNTGKGKDAAFQTFEDECSIGPHGSVTNQNDASSKTHDHYTRKASEIIAEVLNTEAPELAPELWEAVRKMNKVSQLLEFLGPCGDLLLAVMESYK